MPSETSTPCPRPFDTRSGRCAPMFCPAKVAMVFWMPMMGIMRMFSIRLATV